MLLRDKLKPVIISKRLSISTWHAINSHPVLVAKCIRLDGHDCARYGNGSKAGTVRKGAAANLRHTVGDNHVVERWAVAECIAGNFRYAISECDRGQLFATIESIAADFLNGIGYGYVCEVIAVSEAGTANVFDAFVEEHRCQISTVFKSRRSNMVARGWNLYFCQPRSDKSITINVAYSLRERDSGKRCAVFKASCSYPLKFFGESDASQRPTVAKHIIRYFCY